MIRWCILVMFGISAYLVGYNSGAVRGYDQALAYDPTCSYKK